MEFATSFQDVNTPKKIIAGIKLAERTLCGAYDLGDDALIQQAEKRLFDAELEALVERFGRETPLVY